MSGSHVIAPMLHSRQWHEARYGLRFPAVIDMVQYSD